MAMLGIYVENKSANNMLAYIVYNKFSESHLTEIWIILHPVWVSQLHHIWIWRHPTPLTNGSRHAWNIPIQLLWRYYHTSYQEHQRLSRPLRPARRLLGTDSLSAIFKKLLNRKFFIFGIQFSVSSLYLLDFYSLIQFIYVCAPTSPTHPFPLPGIN